MRARAKIGSVYSIWVSVILIDRIIVKNKINKNIKTRRACVRGARTKPLTPFILATLGQTLASYEFLVSVTHD